ncbi:MAG: biotin--[acetyl-CoA-carboxylase] ligase [Eubacterium sp.]
MSSKNKLLTILESNRGHYISGETIAKSLGVSRNSIWKAIKALKEQGYHIESKTNMGYTLLQQNDILSIASLAPWLKDPEKIHHIKIYPTLDSTNTFAKKCAFEGAPDGTVILAEEQTAGRGRMGRAFYSPANSGIYMSMILKPQMALDQALFITSAASVLISRAINTVMGIRPQIKWVNDLFYQGKKICGILTEAATDFETGNIDYLVLGVGINFTSPTKAIPASLQPIIGTLVDQTEDGQLRSHLIAEIINELSTLSTLTETQDIIREYRKYSMVIGKEVLLTSGKTTLTGTVVDINDNGYLLLRTDDDTLHTISSGEVSLRLTEHP